MAECIAQALHDDVAINALLPWFGAKRLMAERIVAELGNHSAYWELFCGSMAVLLAKQPAPMETVNDKHKQLVNLARIIQHDIYGPMFYRRVRRVLCSHELMNEAAERWKAREAAGEFPDSSVTIGNVTHAVEFFVTSWMGRNGVSGTKSYNQGFARRFTKSGGHAATRWCGAVDSIPAWRRRMAGVAILSECGIGLAERVEDSTGVVIYADPPYIEKGAEYVHDFTDEDHSRLARSLSRFKSTRVIVSYYDHPRVRELYSGSQWRIYSVPMPRNMRNQSGETGGETAPEVLIINGESYVQDGGTLWA